MKRPSIASAMEAERPLVTPLAHDALSARLIARAGFKAFAIGGSALLATRFALPEIGLVGVADMTAGIRDIAASTALPFFADGDDGYGDVKSIARVAALKMGLPSDRDAEVGCLSSRAQFDKTLSYIWGMGREESIEELLACTQIKNVNVTLRKNA